MGCATAVAACVGLGGSNQVAPKLMQYPAFRSALMVVSDLCVGGLSAAQRLPFPYLLAGSLEASSA